MTRLPPRFTLADISGFFSSSTLSRGMEYFSEKRVRHWDFNDDAIDSEVKGSGRSPYTQHIELYYENGQLEEIVSECSCPVGYDCKHVVAVLFEVIGHFKTHQRVDLGAIQVPTTTGLAFYEQRWLKEIERELGVDSHQMTSDTSLEKPKNPSFLVFALSAVKHGDGVSLMPTLAKFNTKGELKLSKLPDPLPNLEEKGAFLQAQDLELIGFYKLCIADLYYAESYHPKGLVGAMMMEKIAQAGKLYWRSTVDKEVSLKRLLYRENQTARPTWTKDKATWRLGWQLGDERGITVLSTTPPWYISDAHFGLLHMEQNHESLSVAAINRIINGAPRVPVANHQVLNTLSQRLLEMKLQDTIPLLGELKQVRRDDVLLRPYLLLASYPRNDGSDEIEDFAQLKFSYDGTLLEQDAKQVQIHRSRQSDVEIISRDGAAEDAARTHLLSLGFSQKAKQKFSSNFLHTLPDQAAWLHFSKEELPQLIANNWEIKFHDSYRYHLLDIEEWYAEVAEENQTSPWFDLELGIVVNQNKISLLPVLVTLIRQAPHNFSPSALNLRHDDEQILVQLPDGSRVALPYVRIKPILLVLGELYFHEKQGDSLRLPMLDAARIAELAAVTNLRWIGGERQQNFGKKLAEFGGITRIKSPAGLKAKLRDYQKEGVAWMQFLREYHLAGILADDMGLGKTLQTLTHILIEKNAGRLTQPALVVAPTSLMDNWANEAQRFTPKLKVLVLHGKERAELFAEIPKADLVLTTYALLPRDEDLLRQHTFHLLILDEAQYIKNAQTKASQTASMLQATHRLCLTGTPLQNHLGELWSQFHFLMPGLLGDLKTFTKDFRNPIEKTGDSQRHALLTRKIKPFLLRRTKDKVATELPAKTEIIRHIELVGAQRDLYETVRLAMDKKVRDEISKKGIARSQIVILDALLKLRQVCCDPRLVKLTTSTGRAKTVTKATTQAKATPSAKLTELLDMLDELLDEGRRILIFSQFTSMLALIEAELKEKQIAYALLTGDTMNRGAEVKRFQEGEVPVFLISLKAGGVGLNLTAADTVIHYDPWWNPAVENQATDRAWRIGQDKPVFVYRLIAKGSLEEKILAMQGKKADLARAILDQGDVGSIHFTADDLQGIFTPLESF